MPSFGQSWPLFDPSCAEFGRLRPALPLEALLAHSPVHAIPFRPNWDAWERAAHFVVVDSDKVGRLDPDLANIGPTSAPKSTKFSPPLIEAGRQNCSEIQAIDLADIGAKLFGKVGRVRTKVQAKCSAGPGRRWLAPCQWATMFRIVRSTEFPEPFLRNTIDVVPIKPTQMRAINALSTANRAVARVTGKRQEADPLDHPVRRGFGACLEV